MSTFEEIRGERLKKLKAIKDAGVNPFPVSKKSLNVAGRVMAIRLHGGSVFADINDGNGSMQCYIKKNDIGEEAFALFADTVDIGDFLEISGSAFVTKKEENSLAVSSFRTIAKSLRPLPEKWHGLKDVEERFRKRYLDILMNEEVKERFILRSKIISELRNYINGKGFLEVETPMLQALAGGALAQPFKTHHNALDIDLFLRVAPELYLKKLLVAGFDKVFEIGRNFRNEGIDATHNPEFTMLELYEAYRDADYLKDFTEDLFRHLVETIFGGSEIICGEQRISFAKKFTRLSYYEVFKRYALMGDVDRATREDFAIKAKQLGIKVEDFESKEKIMDNIYKKICRPKIIQPTFIEDYPSGASPLAKRKENNPDLIDRFQLVINGGEVINAFSELNDPIDQKERFAQQDKMKEMGEKDVSPSDDDYLEAMEYGMPPAAGLGMGIDRLIMLFTSSSNIKEVIIFPTMRPKDGQDGE